MAKSTKAGCTTIGCPRDDDPGLPVSMPKSEMLQDTSGNYWCQLCSKRYKLMNWAKEMLEYHITGGEIDPEHQLPEPGWYPCHINWIDEEDGNVEITLTSTDLDEIDVTVLKRNIPIAFRRIPEPPMSSGEMLQFIREETDEHIPSLAELIDLS